ncbi:MAG: hypothetical protein HP491_08270 [Nitrospira sp.]|nr:hypothetical protein [Nitrospira sp.]
MTSPQTDKRPTLYLIDGSAYIYRAFFALPALNNSKGLQTNAVYGFTTTLLKIIRERHPDGIAVAFDEKGPTMRHEEFKDYKAQRPPMPDGMKSQIPYIHRIVDALAIPGLRQAGYEADDLIGTLARKAEQAGYDIVIVTGDKDMFQLLTPHVRIYDPVKDKWSGEAECRERFGVEPARVVEIMGLMGDASDNIPGVKGIGEKTAMKLIAQFGTIEELLNRVGEVTPARIQALLVEQAENARMSRRLATIEMESPVDFDPRWSGCKRRWAQRLHERFHRLLGLHWRIVGFVTRPRGRLCDLSGGRRRHEGWLDRSWRRHFPHAIRQSHFWTLSANDSIALSTQQAGKAYCPSGAFQPAFETIVRLD